MTIADIAQMTGLSEADALRGVDELVEAGFLDAIVLDGLVIFRQRFPDGTFVDECDR